MGFFATPALWSRRIQARPEPEGLQKREGPASGIRASGFLAASGNHCFVTSLRSQIWMLPFATAGLPELIFARVCGSATSVVIQKYNGSPRELFANSTPNLRRHAFPMQLGSNRCASIKSLFRHEKRRRFTRSVYTRLYGQQP